ncbi:hypothetical protein ACGFX8_24675 [Streptomyces sp. NPDC048362]|uniref:hypothetical protein n=1 Tax=Streptomyces sp. NPDC048362 TaxID=3365539 RepID=UPI00371DB406
MELTWSKQAAGSYYATNQSGNVVATARKEGKDWHVEVANDNRVRQVGTYRQAKGVAARVLADQRWEQVRAENLTEGDTLRFIDGEATVTAVEPVGNNLGQLRISYAMEDGSRATVTMYPGSLFERAKVEVEQAEESSAVEVEGLPEMEGASLPILAEDIAPGDLLLIGEGVLTVDRVEPLPLAPERVNVHFREGFSMGRRLVDIVSLLDVAPTGHPLRGRRARLTTKALRLAL